MNYIGGKHKQGAAIARIIRPYLKGGSLYIEPFCGAMGSASALAKILDPSLGVRMTLSDSHEALITLWRSVQAGWIPPTEVSEELYYQHKAVQDPTDPLTAFIGFGCSFGGKYFGGYKRNYKGGALPTVGPIRRGACSCSRDLVLRRIETLKSHNPVILCSDYRHFKDTVGAVFYLDPPYINGTKQSKFTFDHDEFWDFARKLSVNNHVFITEFEAPDDFIPIYSFGDTVVRHHSAIESKKGLKNEQIFVLGMKVRP
jgi:DNA adenine methylase